MKSLRARAAGKRLARMQASPRWAGNGFRNIAPIRAHPRRPARPGRHDAEPERLSLRWHAPRQRAHLLMPQLGQPVEPAQVDSVTPWWRAVDHGASAPAQAVSWPKAAVWPLD